MTYSELCAALSEGGIHDAPREAALLLECFCGLAPEKLPLSRGVDFDTAALRGALRKRLERYPLQYIIGEWGFCGERYILNSDCLIPRPDTELLVESAARLMPPGGSFLDAGCGSGCISVSLIAARPDARGTAFDISAGALEAAARNAAANRVEGRLKLTPGDMLKPDLWRSIGSFDAIISNPPYIPAGEIPLLEPELRHEPLRALDGGADGLDFYRAIIKYAGAALGEGGFILLEVGCGQSGDVASLAGAGGYSAEPLCDIEGRERALVLRRAQNSEIYPGVDHED